MVLTLLILISCIGSFAALVLDVRSRIIPNELIFSLFIILLFVMLWLPFDGFTAHVKSFLLGGVLFTLLFYLNVWGGGDAKLMMVLSLSVPIEEFWIFVLSILLVGGIQGVMWWLCFPQDKSLPYGVAIFLGYLLYELSFLLNFY